MPSDPPESRSHLTWQLLPTRIARQRLETAGLKPPDGQAEDDIAVLYAYAADQSPVLLASMPCHPECCDRLLREAAVENRFSQWFERNRHADIWRLAAAWHFYRDWLTGLDVAHWQSRLIRHFDAWPFTDALLAPSCGWILWEFQVRFLCSAALRNADATTRAVDTWIAQTSDMSSTLASLALPDGTDLVGVLGERAYRDREGTVMAYSDPDLPLAYALRRLR